MRGNRMSGISLTHYSEWIRDIVDKHYKGTYKEELSPDYILTCVDYHDPRELDKDLYKVLNAILAEQHAILDREFKDFIEQTLKKEPIGD